MTIEKMINKYEIKVTVTNGVEGLQLIRKPSAKEIGFIKTKKQEIINELKSRAAAVEARKARINAIEGLKEIQNAIHAEEVYRDSFNRMMTNESATGLAKKPSVSAEELKERYPVAAAYLKAEKWSRANDFRKATAGETAKEKIINGENYINVLEEMEAEWEREAEESIWNN